MANNQNPSTNQKSNRYKNIDIKYDLLEIAGFFRNHLLITLCLLFIIIIVSSLFVFENLIFKSIIDESTNFSQGIISKDAFLSTISLLFLFLLIIFLIKSVGNWVRIHLLNSLEVKIIAELKRKYFNHIIRLDYDFFTSNRIGSIISKITRSGGAIERFVDVFVFNFIPLIVSLITAIISLAYLGISYILLLLITFTIFIAISLFIQKKQNLANSLANEREDIEKGEISDYLANVESIKYFGKENYIKKKFFTTTENTKLAFLKFWNYFRWSSFFQNLILGIGTLALILLTIFDFLAGLITVGTIVFVYTTFQRLLLPLYEFIHGVRGYYRSLADLDPLFKYGKLPNAIKDIKGAKDYKVKEGDVEFKNVTFSYANKKIFDNFSLKIPKNKKVALVGHSGSGKTTLIKLLYRLYDVDSGSIEIDKINIRSFKQEALRRELSIVPQECILFNDTIYNNILFSNPTSSKKEVMHAIKVANLDELIDSLPFKENTIVGEKGVKLSGGEKQRVSIARAVLAKKEILILDEATSSLDSQTELEIKEALEKLMRNKTTIIIAHRLSTIMNSDLIVVMKKGKIVQIGNHNELINQLGEYKKLWNIQKGGYIVE